MDFLNQHEDQQGRGLTYDLWKNFPVNQIFALRDFNAGYGVYPNLASFDCAVDAAAPTVLYGTDGARGYIDTGCTIKQLTAAQGGVGGGIRLATTTTDNGEASLQWCGASGSPFLISDTAAELRDLCLEFAFRTSSVAADAPSLFMGLAEEGCAAADLMVDDTGVMADKDFLGFQRITSDPDALNIIYKKAGQTAVDHKLAWKTIAANTWYHLGLRFDSNRKIIVPYFGTGDRSTTLVAPDNDNKIVAADIASTTDIFPDSEGFAPLVAMKNGTNVAYTFDVRLAACAQVAPAAD